MTVRVHLHDERLHLPGRGWRWAEYVFLFVGLLALDCFIWVNLDSTFYQAYESWSFDREVKGSPVSVGRFVAYELGIDQHPSEPSIAVPVGAENERSRETTKPDSAGPAKRRRAGISTAAGVQGKPKPLAVIGRIAVPRLRLSAMVREGVGDDILRRAVGHIPYTALPGEQGNIALAGHRDTFFRKLRDIKRSDRITVSTLHGDYDYQVESVRIVTPQDVSVLKAVPGEQALTLVTCFPFNYIGSAPKRFIVKALQVDVATPPQQSGF